MNKKQKSSIILASLASIAVAGSVIAGSTYALFTSEAKTNIAVTSGTVNVGAKISDLSLYTPTEISTEEGNAITNAANIATTNSDGLSGTFGLGGTATLDDGTLTLDRMTPGDKATFKIAVTNYSNVNVKYRTKIAVTEDSGLFAGLKLNIGGVTVQSSSIWKNLAPATEEGVVVSSYDCYVELPTTAGNTYQNYSCKIEYTVEAVQGNAATTNDAGASVGAASATSTVSTETVNDDTFTTGTTTLVSPDSVAVSESETKSVASATVPTGAQVEAGTTSLTLNVYETSTPSNFTIAVNDEQSCKTMEVEMKGLSSDNAEPVKVVMYIGKDLDGLKLYHNNNSMTKKERVEDVASDQDYYYASDSGFITMLTSKFSPFTYVFDAKVVSTVSEFVSALNDKTVKTIKLDDNLTIDSNDYSVNKRLYVDRDDLTIDLNKKTFTAPNCALTITGDNVTIKNGTMVSANGGSYTMQIYTGINVLVDDITMTGGVNVAGKNSASSDPDASVTITNCNITGTNYYAVCAQRNSVVYIKESTLAGGKVYTFWAEKTGYSESGSAKAEVDSKISYEKDTVTFVGEKDLYNPVGVAPVEINSDGNLSWAHDAYTLEKVLDDENIATVKLVKDIDLTSVLGVAHSVTIDFCGKKINASGEMIDDYQHVIQILNTKTSANKLTFKDSVGGGEFNSTYGGIKLYSSNASFELNDVTMTVKTGEAISVYDSGCFIVEEGFEEYSAVESTSIVINSGKIVSERGIRSGNDHGGQGHTVTINGGSIECSGWGIFLSNNCILTINKCDFTVTGSRPIIVCEKDSSSVDNKESSVIINDITFTGTKIKVGTGKPDIQYVIVLYSGATGENVVIYKGTFNVEGNTTEITKETHPYGN